MTRHEMAGCQFRASYGASGVRYYVLRPNAERWERTTEADYNAAALLLEEGHGKNLPYEYHGDVERISFEIDKELPQELAQPEAPATPDAQTIEADLIASTHGAPMPEYAKPIKGAWELAVSQTDNALEMGKRNIFGDNSLPDAALLNMGDVSTLVEAAVEQVTLALQAKDHVWEGKELDAFMRGFVSAAPDCLDCDADASTDTPWQAPWTWCDEADYRLDADPYQAGRLFAMRHRAEIEELCAYDNLEA